MSSAEPKVAIDYSPMLQQPVVSPRKLTHRDLIQGWNPFTPEECALYTAKGFWKNLVTSDLLDRNAENFPNKLAFADGVIEVTWKESRQRARRLALHLHRMGIAYGDFVVLDMMNTVYAMDVLFGLNLLGAIPVMCLPRHRKLEVSYHVQLHQAKGIVLPVGEKFDYVGMVNEFIGECGYCTVRLTVGGKAPEGWTSIEELLNIPIEQEYPDDYLDQFKPHPDDFICEHLSGGTTGVPKGIPRTYNDQICQWDVNGQALGHTDESVPMVTLPVLHNAGMVAFYGPMTYRGGTTIICRSPLIEDMWKLIEKYKVTHLMFIPIQMSYWIESAEKMKNYDLSSLRVIGGAAEKVRPELIEWFLKNLRISFINIFGMAEGPCIFTRWDGLHEPATNTIGKPVIIDSCVQFKLVDDDNEEVKQGEIGEMVSKGPLTFKGYFRSEEENKKCWDADGFFHSGDLMSQRPDGRYVVEGRKKDMIKRAGENVYPPVVEDRIAKFDKVAFCAVVGMPDMKLGEKLCAFVQPVAGQTLSLKDVTGFLKGLGVAVYELPERVEVVEGWPLSPINKIDKRQLRAYITAKAFQEGEITRERAEEYLKRDKYSLDDLLAGRVKIPFIGTPK
ncbi:MAG: AMP-binding protein [Terriglobales bacterium]